MVEALKGRSRREKAARRQVSGAKGGQKKQKQPSIASNGVPSIATARMVYLWSWGPIVGPVNGLRSIKLDGTPLVAEDGTVNFPGVKWQFRSGELNQPRLEGVTEASNEIQVGHELRSTTPWVHSITNPVIDAVRVRLAWPQLQRQDSNGNVDGVRIEYAIDVATDGGPYQQVLASEVNRKNVTKYERSHRVELPNGARWTIRVRRLTAEANSSTVADGMLVDAIAEVVDSDQEYPLTAVSCIEYDAQQFDGDIAKIAALMRGRIVSVPTNYNPETRAYATSGAGTSNGIWDGSFKEAYTNNPAWVFYDLVLHPYYGLGDRIDASMINRWSLYRIGQYCDQLVPDGKGGQEPRFTCNLYLQKQADAWAVLQDLAAIFHGLAYWDGSQISVNADMPQDSAFTYTLSQILGDGAIEYTGSRWRDRNSLALVSFDDPDQGYETDKEPVFDEDAIAEYGVRETSIEAVGCTSRGQAQRAGQWALQTEQLQLRGATLRVGLDGYIPKPGKVISLSDPMLAGRANGGRIAAATGRVVTVDRDIEVPTGARLLVNLPSGKTEARQVRSVAGRKVTVMADYSELPQAECAWALDYDDLKLMQFYVRNVTRPEWHQFQLEVIQHEPSKFDAVDFGTIIDDRPISVLPAGVQEAPARVLISSHSVVDQGIAVTTMTIAWDAAPGAVAYEVEWRWGARDWVKMPRTGELSTDVRGVYAGQYMARVRAISATGVASIPTTSVMTALQGKTTPPPAITHLVAEGLIFAIGLKWGFPQGAADTQRTELWYSEGTDLAKATKLADLAYPQDKHTLQGLRAGQRFYFWARLVDKSGNIGPWFPSGTTLVAGMASADAGPILEQIKDQITASELGKELTSKIEKIDGNGPGSVNERVTTASNAIKADVNKQLIQVNSTIDGVRSNLQGQVTAVEGRMTTARDDLQRQISEVSSIAGALPYNKTKTYALDQAVLGANGKLYQAKKAVPVNVAPPNTDYWEDVGQSVRTANGTASAVSKLQTDVTTLGDTVTATSGKVDGFQASINTANSNASAAQGAAQAANDLAGGKGKVIVQNAAPAAADRLPQNLWIDTTSGANTPKRWNGSAWVSVSDKVATDAAAAAQNALNQVGSKADASAVNALKLTVEQQGRDLTSQGSTLNGLQTTIDGKASSQALTQLSNRVKLTEDKNGLQDDTLKSQSESLTTLKDTVAKKADVSTVNQLANDVKTQGDNVTAQGSALTRIDTKLLSGQDNSPTKVYQSVFSDMAQDQWVSTNTGAGASASFGTPAGITRGAALILDGGSGNRTWWGASTRKIRFDPSRLYKLTVRVQQVAMGTGAPGIYAGLDCYAEDGKTRISTQGTNSVGSSHYVLLGNKKLSQGEWATAEVYVKGHTTGSEGGASGAGTIADPKRLKEGAAWFSPMVIAGYSDIGGQIVVDYFDIEDATEQAQIDAGATATFVLGGRVDKTEEGLKSVSEQTTRLTSDLSTASGIADKAQKAAQAATDLAGGKGKVIVQSAAPAAADRLPQNLWIDTTSGANTPKRWNGLAWVAVSDKVATDAAAAAASALSEVAKKADATALSSLKTTVDQQGRDITANSTSVIALDSALARTQDNSPTKIYQSVFSGMSADRWVGEFSGAGATTAFGQEAGSTSGATLTLGGGPNNVTWWGSSTRKIRFDPSRLYKLSVRFKQLTAGSGNPVTYAGVDGFAEDGSTRINTNGANSKDSSHYVITGGRSYPIGEWVEFSTYVRGHTVGNEGGGTGAGTITDPKRLKAGIAWFSPMFVAGYNNVGGTLALDYFTVEDVTEQVQLDANATATFNLSSRVESTEGALTSTSGQLTELTNSLGDIGGENLVFNPSFEKPDPGTPGIADGWWYDGTGSGLRNPSLVPSTLASGLAQRLDITGLTSSTWARAYVKFQYRFKPTPGKAYTASVYMRGTAGLRILVQVYGTTESGAGTQSWAGSRVDATEAWTRLTVTFTPGADTSMIYAAIVVYGGASVSGGYIEADQYQIELGTRATGWKDNGQVVAANQSATSTLVDALTSTVGKQGGDLTTVTGKVTKLEGSVTNLQGDLPKKADVSALTTLKGTVEQNGRDIKAQGLDLTTITTTLGGIGASGVNLLPAEYSVFSKTPPTLAGTSYIASTVADSATLRGYALKFDWSTTSSALTAFFAKALNLGDANMGAKRQKYIISYYARASVAGHVIALYLRGFQSDGSSYDSPGATQQALTTGWTRYSYVADMSANAFTGSQMILAIQLNRSGVANRSIWIDRIMVEPVVNNISEPSTYVVGNSFDQATATATALSQMETTVNQQGIDLTAESRRIDGLTTTVGKNTAAVQSEATTRSNADGALSRRIDTVQATAGSASSAVEGVATAQANLKGELNAQYTMRVQINDQYKVHHWGGFGIGISNTGGVVQSAFVVYSDQFILLNSNGAGLSSPFSVVGGQTFIADAYIRDASIGTAKITDASISNAKIADASISTAKIGVAEIDTLRIRGNAVTVPISYSLGGEVRGNGRFKWITVLEVTIPMDTAGYVFIMYNSAQSFSDGGRGWGANLTINGVSLSSAGGISTDGTPILSGSIAVGPGVHTIKVEWHADDASVSVYQRNLFAMGTKR